ncbi:MAG: cation-translocating P-type ATPase [Bacillota bacterium]|nr:cation-translocating P-type ATPase [Bacillota bacterium]
MKSIDHLAEDAIKDRSREYMTEKDKKRFGREIRNSSGALACLLAALIYRRFFPEQDATAGLIYLAGALMVGVPIFLTGLRGFSQKKVDNALEILVSIAVIVCILDGQYVLAILIPIILTLVHFLEEKSIVGGRDAIEGLKKMQAATALLLEGENEREVDARELKAGDRILVKPGMSLPIDGTVLTGVSNMDQQSLTGESLPKSVSPGDKVFAGTINIDGALVVSVDKVYSDTSFQKIVQLLEEAEGIVIPETRIIDRFMIYYIPLALVVATFAWLLSQDVSKAVAILVVSCPCGLMLVNSAPMIAALAMATRKGILIKNSKFVEKLADAECVVFDKTGTVTSGTLEAAGYRLEEAASYDELISAAASVAHNSLHPVSRALFRLCEDGDYEKDYQVTEYTGQGLIGKKGASEILIGNARWLGELGYQVKDPGDSDGSASWVVRDGRVLGCVVFRDIPREEAPAIIEELKEMGIEKTCLLTGDKRLAAERIARAVAVGEMYCELLPEQKLEKVKELKGSYDTVFIGDGINDAPALLEADVGIAMGAMGSDTAIQSADISLMNNDLTNIPYAIRLARRTRRIIYQNMVMAFLISFVMISLAAAGVIGALAGAFLHNIGAFLILINSGRLMKQ